MRSWRMKEWHDARRTTGDGLFTGCRSDLKSDHKISASGMKFRFTIMAHRTKGTVGPGGSREIIDYRQRISPATPSLSRE